MAVVDDVGVHTVKDDRQGAEILPRHVENSREAVGDELDFLANLGDELLAAIGVHHESVAGVAVLVDQPTAARRGDQNGDDGPSGEHAEPRSGDGRKLHEFDSGWGSGKQRDRRAGPFTIPSEIGNGNDYTGLRR